MRYEGETGSTPWNDEGPVIVGLRPVRVFTNCEPTPNTTDLPVPAIGVPCAEDPEVWVGARTWMESYAVRVCEFCPMRPACAEYGVKHPEEIGVWGGLTQLERRKQSLGREGLDPGQ